MGLRQINCNPNINIRHLLYIFLAIYITNTHQMRVKHATFIARGTTAKKKKTIINIRI